MSNIMMINCAGVTKSGFWCSRSEASILGFNFAHLNPLNKILFTIERRNVLQVGVGSAISQRMYSAASSGLASASDRSDRKPAGKSSLYARPSLLQMQQDRLKARETVYEFLRSLGIVPDELNGLELPVSIEVMRERIDFLHKLGLTVSDINNYPLVLGCSVKKNMIPVLDYLGKLGVRKSTFADFLRRYPQVLHSSVVVDLQPVVKYLQGLDIKENDIPRVLERYPEVLGFKLEGTMSTSVAYLVGIGVGRREIGPILTRYPEILGMRVGRVIKPFVEMLESIGVPRQAVARLIENRPHMLGFSLGDQVRPNIDALIEFGVRKQSLPSIIVRYPEIAGLDLRSKLLSQQNFFKYNLDVNPEEFGGIVEKMPQVVSLNQTPIMKHIDFLKGCGFSQEDMKTMVLGCPQILALNIDIMKLNFDYFQHEMERKLEDIVAFPAFFTYSLEATIKPRHKRIAKKGLKCSLGWLLNCSDQKFDERMSYDFIDIEEMEAEPSFDMESFSRPKEYESSSEYDDDSEDDDDM
ncbi:transcription termination factor MTERF4, chloroplastic-like [Nymphaea colorata]|nr:transcription termination factor MTERF4, chloroplastic-like [Nymphaea colorata]XP_031501328.1 transcription termination factor MTERF4, chloroplastic-like [Nymphaea colorata]XP_031501329.1 transcription termination factor MTERF4, chloroplastic-like [Nymphaea colorata]